MKQHALQAVFVATFLLIAALIVHRGQPGIFHLSSAQAQAQDADRPPFLGGPAYPARIADRQAAIATVQAQLQAFKKDDFEKAVQYQSRGLKQRYGSAADFRSSIQQGYPAFIHFKTVSFGSAQTSDRGQHLFLPVTLIEAKGLQVHAFYMMVREDKVYKVDGVQGGEAVPIGAGGVPSQQT